MFLGRIDKNESISLVVKLNVPIEVGNEFANSSGEVDWIFTVEDAHYGEAVETGDKSNVIASFIGSGVFLYKKATL